MNTSLTPFTPRPPFVAPPFLEPGELPEPPPRHVITMMMKLFSSFACLAITFSTAPAFAQSASADLAMRAPSPITSSPPPSTWREVVAEDRGAVEPPSHFATELGAGSALRYGLGHFDDRFAGARFTTAFGWRGDGVAFYGMFSLLAAASVAGKTGPSGGGTLFEGRPGLRLELFHDRFRGGFDVECGGMGGGDHDSAGGDVLVGGAGYFAVDLVHQPNGAGVMLGARLEATHYIVSDEGAWGPDAFLAFHL